MSTICRYCGSEGAYDSGFTVECPNFQCDHYSSEQRKIYLSHRKKWQQTNKLLQDYLSDESTDADITPVYHWGVALPLDDLDEDD